MATALGILSVLLSPGFHSAHIRTLDMQAGLERCSCVTLWYHGIPPLDVGGPSFSHHCKAYRA